MAMKTITLKLHKPSKRKRQIIDKAMLDYSRAFQYLLDKAFGEIELIKSQYRNSQGNYRSLSVSKWIDKNTSEELNRYNIQPFKDSLKIDFGMTLASYLTLKETRKYAGYPTAYLSESQWIEKNDNIFFEFVNGSKSYEQYQQEIEKLIRKHNVLKPLYFCRYAHNRDYCLLYDKANDRYYAKLYLMNCKDENRKIINSSNQKEMEYICKSPQAFVPSDKKERFIIVPLSFGKWQESYLKKALESPQILKTARLVKKNGSYYLCINIEMECAEKVQTETFLGISRGIKNIINYTVVDKNSRIIANMGIKPYPHVSEKSKWINKNNMHGFVNQIIEEAVKNKSQVIVQNLTEKNDRLKWNYSDEYKPHMDFKTYNTLVDIISYKLEEKGLPLPVRVSPVGAFYTCPRCGLYCGRNRLSGDMFICIDCGMATDIESLGSVNTARRLIKYGMQSLKLEVKITSKGITFSNQELGLNFSPLNPHNCIGEFKEEIKRIISEFYSNLDRLPRDKSFKKKYSMIKKIEEAGIDRVITML